VTTTPLHFRCILTALSPTTIYTPSLHDALPISERPPPTTLNAPTMPTPVYTKELTNRVEGLVMEEKKMARRLHLRSRSLNSSNRSEEHTSELQSRFDLVCRLLLEKKKQLD